MPSFFLTSFVFWFKWEQENLISKFTDLWCICLYLQPDDDCTNATVVEPEIRYDDPIFKRLIAQVWADYQYKLNQEGKLYDYVIDPLEVDSKLPKPINDSYSGSGYTANVQMHDIKV